MRLAPPVVAVAAASLLALGVGGPVAAGSPASPPAPGGAAQLTAPAAVPAAVASVEGSRATTTPAPGSDADNDGLTARVEAQVGTSPTNPDTDGDRLADGGDPDIVAVVVSRLPAKALRGPAGTTRRAVLRALNTAESAYARGAIERGSAVLKTLRTRLDGCPPRPGRDDWVVRCPAQLSVRALIDLVVRNHVSVRVDPAAVQPAVATLPALDTGAARPVAAVRGPDGATEDFVADEIVVHPQSAAELAALLTAYHGTVIRSGTPRVLSGDPPADLPASTGWYLVRVDTTASALTDLVSGLDASGLRGRWTFSSEQGARLASLVAREEDHGVSANTVTAPDQTTCTVCEHPDFTGWLDAATWWWMTQDDDPTTPGEQGLSIGVIRAWDYLRYKGFPPLTPFYPVRVAVVDEGFALDTTTGAPLTGAKDYFYSGTGPDQIDEVDHDLTAGGPNSKFPWHGQGVFGVCCANARNGFGTAGISGGGTTGAEVRTLLLRFSGDRYAEAAAIWDAIYNYADVINISWSGTCGSWCRTSGGGKPVMAAVNWARDHGIIVVSSAGNDGKDISSIDQFPCMLNGVICVGAIDSGAAAQSYSNFGSKLDIWAPADVFSTVTPDSAAVDSDNVGDNELDLFGGTSCAAPFITGVVALMKAVNHDLTYDQVRSILASTANTSSDPLVAPRGYVDALRAVQAAAPNQPPTVAFTLPAAGASVGYQQVGLKAHLVDPEASGPWASSFTSRVDFRSDLDGALCSATGTGPDLYCEATTLRQGTHVLTVTATDPFGATATATRTVTVTNQNPVVIISNPPNGATFKTSQQINLHAVVFDPDEVLTGNALAWKSSITGSLGTGFDRWVTLPAGTHTITATATDSLGATGSSTVTVTVQSAAGYPTAQITSPADRSVVSYNKPVTLTGTATDPEDGALTGASLRWTSDLDGFLGTGTSLTVTLSGGPCTEVLHQLTLQATDSDGHVATHTIQVGVVSIC